MLFVTWFIWYIIYSLVYDIKQHYDCYMIKVLERWKFIWSCEMFKTVCPNVLWWIFLFCKDCFTCMFLHQGSLYLYAFTMRSLLSVCFYTKVPFTCMLLHWGSLYLDAFTPRSPLPVCFLRSSGWGPVVTEARSTVHPLC